MERHRNNWLRKLSLVLPVTFGLVAPFLAAEGAEIRDPLEITADAGTRFESNAENKSGGRPGLILDGSLALDQALELREGESLKFGASFTYEKFFFERREFENEEDEDDGSDYNIKASYAKKYEDFDATLTGKFVDTYEEVFKRKDDRSYRLELEFHDKERIVERNNLFSKKYREKLFLQQRFDRFFEAQRTKVEFSLTYGSKYETWSISKKPFVFHEWFYSASPRRRDFGAGFGVTFSRKIDKRERFTLEIGPKVQAVHSTDDERKYAEIILPLTIKWKTKEKPLWKW